jgi:hypothetical protein
MGMPRVHLAAVTLAALTGGVLPALSGCSLTPPTTAPDPASQASADAGSYGDLFAAIKDDPTVPAGTMRLYLSSSQVDRAGLCRLAAGERCDAAHPTYMVATKVFEKQGRRILGFATGVPAATDRSYVIVQDGGAVLATFNLVDPTVDPLGSALAGINGATLREELTFITRDELKGRLSATPENEQVADWLIDHLKRLGIAPGNAGDYRQRFRLGVGPTGSAETANIIGLIEGTDATLKGEYIVIGAHMDHAGSLSRGYTCSQGSIAGDSICNGADDNGSGTIALLNVAKALAAVRGQLKRSVVIMWFSGEEEGLIGSKYYVGRPVFPLAKTVYMINLDMVGYMKSFGNTLAALGGGSSRAGKAVIAEIAKKYPERKIDVSDRAGGGSDHAPFFAKGIPGVFYHTGVSNNPNYHRTSDHVDKIDFDGMTMATKVAFETGYRVATSSGDTYGAPGRSGDLAAEAGGFYGGESREPLVTEEELAQSCHHLIQNPFAQEMAAGLDFTNGNDGRP